MFLVFAMLFLLGVYRVYCGLCSLSTIREVVDEALRRKLNVEDKGITFEKLRYCGALPLKLIATNVTDGDLELFCYETTPEVVVADAVCASMCIPFVFKRWSFAFRRRGEAEAVERQFIDGGLMSNLPSWSFDEERALNNQALTIAFGLRRKDATEGSVMWLMSALNAVIEGPPQIHLRGINRLIHIPLESTLGLLDFDKSFDDFRNAVREAKEEALAQIVFEVTEVPKIIRKNLKELRDVIEEMLYLKYGSVRQGTSHLFRVALAIQRPNAFSTLSVAYTIGRYGGGTKSVLSLDASSVGAAWRDRQVREPVLEIFDSDAEPSDKVFTDSAWMLPVPVPSSDLEAGEIRVDEPAVVLIIDSPFELGEIRQQPDELDEYASFLYGNVLGYVTDKLLGESVRRSVAWL